MEKKPETLRVLNEACRATMRIAPWHRKTLHEGT